MLAKRPKHVPNNISYITQLCASFKGREKEDKRFKWACRSFKGFLGALRNVWTGTGGRIINCPVDLLIVTSIRTDAFSWEKSELTSHIPCAQDSHNASWPTSSMADERRPTCNLDSFAVQTNHGFNEQSLNAMRREKTPFLECSRNPLSLRTTRGPRDVRQNDTRHRRKPHATVEPEHKCAQPEIDETAPSMENLPFPEGDGAEKNTPLPQQEAEATPQRRTNTTLQELHPSGRAGLANPKTVHYDRVELNQSAGSERDGWRKR